MPRPGLRPNRTCGADHGVVSGSRGSGGGGRYRPRPRRNPPSRSRSSACRRPPERNCAGPSPGRDRRPDRVRTAAYRAAIQSRIGQGLDRLAGQGEQRVGHRRGQRRQARLADAGRGIVRRHDMHVDRRHVGHPRHDEAVEIALLDLAVPQRDLRAVECGADRHQHRALDLGLDRAGIDREIAVDRAGHPMKLRRIVLDRQLHHVGDDRAERLVYRASPKARPAGSVFSP